MVAKKIREWDSPFIKLTADTSIKQVNKKDRDLGRLWNEITLSFSELGEVFE